MKKCISMLLVVLMLLSIMPMGVYAADENGHDVTVMVDTTDYSVVEPGQVLKVPVNITSNAGVSAFALEAHYNTDVFEMVEGVDRFTVDDESIDNALIQAGCEAGENVAFNSGSNVRKTTGVFAFLNLKVKEDAPAGTYPISLVVPQPVNDNFLYYDSENQAQVPITPTLIAGEVTVYREATETTYVNGTQTGIDADWVLAEANGTRGYTLTKPDSENSYHFAGWFTGLGNDLKDENGFYVIEANRTQTEFSGSEIRVRYPSSGDVTATYNALWIKGDGSYVLVVRETDFDVYAGSEDTAVLSAAVEGAAGTGRVKLVKDMTTTSSVVAEKTLVLDLNGNTISRSGTIIELQEDGSMVESSRAGGCLNGTGSETLKVTGVTTTDPDDQYATVTDYTAAKVRDITVNGTKQLLYGQFETVENCVFNASATSSRALQFSNNEVCGTTEVINCEINTGCMAIWAGANLTVKITDCEITAGEKATSYLFEGNKSTSKLEFLGTNTVKGEKAKNFAKNFNEIKFATTNGTYLISPEATALCGKNTNTGDPFVGNFLGPDDSYVVNLIDGRITVDKKVTVGGEEVSGTADLTIVNEQTEAVVESAAVLAELHKLTVNSGNATLNFLADALDNIAALVNGAAKIGVEALQAEAGEAARVSLTVKDSSGNAVDFSGAVEVSIPFASDADASGYKAYFLNGDTREALATTITGDAANGWVAHFTVNHFSDYAVADPASLTGYTSGLNANPAKVPAGQTVTVNVAVNSTGTDDTVFNAAEVVVKFDPAVLTFDESVIQEVLGEGVNYKLNDAKDTLTIEDFGADKYFGNAVYVLKFNTVETVEEPIETEIELISAKFIHKENAHADDLQGAAVLEPASLTITVDLEAFEVTYQDDQVTGNAAASRGEDLTVTVKDSNLYDYTLTVKVNGEVIDPAFVDDNGDGTFTILGEKVTGPVEISYDRDPKSFNVSFTSPNGTEDYKDLVNPSTVATYGTDYVLTIPELEDHEYRILSSGVTIGGKTADSSAWIREGNTLTIYGSAITGDIKIEINRIKVVLKVELAGNAMADGQINLVTDNGTENVYDAGDKIEVVITPLAGYTYEIVTWRKSEYATDYSKTGTFTLDQLVQNDDGTFTLNSSASGVSAWASLDSDWRIEINRSLSGAVEITAESYLDLNADLDGFEGNLYLVTYYAELEGSVATFDGIDMLWSEKYAKEGNTGAWSCLIAVQSEVPTQDELLAKIAVRVLDSENNETRTSIDYTGDVNMTNGNVDASDAQFVYNMYKAEYACMDGNTTMEKFLRADMNGDKTVDVEDAIAILDKILNPTE